MEVVASLCPSSLLFTIQAKFRVDFLSLNLPCTQSDMPEIAPVDGDWVGMPVFKKHFLSMLFQVKESHEAFKEQSAAHLDQLGMSSMLGPMSEPGRSMLSSWHSRSDISKAQHLLKAQLLLISLP